MTWSMLDDAGRVWGTVVGGNVVRVELKRSGALGADGAHALSAAIAAARAVQRELDGFPVKQLSIGAPGFGYESLGSAADVPIIVEAPGERR